MIPCFSFYEGIDIAGLPTVSVYDKALGTRDSLLGGGLVQTGWKGRAWFLSAHLIPGGNTGAVLLGSGVSPIVNGSGVLTNVSVSEPGDGFRLRVKVYTVPASRYVPCEIKYFFLL